MGLGRVKEATISAENTFSGWLPIDAGLFSLNLDSADWTSTTVFLQRSYDGGSTIYDVESYTEDTALTGEEAEGCSYRFGCKTGGYGGTAVTGRLGQ